MVQSPYRNEQSFSKAVNRVKIVLLQSLRKKIAVIKKLAVQVNIPLIPVASVLVVKNKETENLVKQFYNSDIVSCMLPGRRDCITIAGENGTKEKEQKKILLMTVMEAFQIFKQEYPEIKVGKSNFASLRPSHVLPASETDYTVCCCRYYENFDMLTAGLKKLHPNLPGANQVILDSVWSRNNKKFSSSMFLCEKNSS